MRTRAAIMGIIWLTAVQSAVTAGPQGDLNDDLFVDLADFAFFQREFTGPDCFAGVFAADFDGDGCVALADFSVLVGEWAGPRIISSYRLSPYTDIEFTADGNLTEFLSLGDGQNYIDLAPGPTLGDILDTVVVTPGVLVVKDEEPVAAGPTGFNDLPGWDIQGGPGNEIRVPTGFNIGRMFVSYNPQIDAYFVAFDVSAPGALDVIEGTQPLAFDVDGDGDLCTLTELNPTGCVGEDITDAPTKGDDIYRVLLDVDGDGLNDVRVQVVETTNSPPAGSVVLTSYDCGGSLPSITRYLSIEPLDAGQIDTAAFANTHLDSDGDRLADSGSVGVGADVEFMISNVSKGCDQSADPDCANDPFLTRNADPCCVRFTSFVDTDDDDCLGGGAEDGTTLEIAFPCPHLEATKNVRCVDQGVGVGVFQSHARVLPDGEVEFEIELRNTGGIDLALTIDDVLSCIPPAASELVLGTCTVEIPAAGIIPDFCDQFENAFAGSGFPIPIGVLGGPPLDASGCPAGDGESFVFRFHALVGPSGFCESASELTVDCTNRISFEGTAFVDSTPRESELNPHEFLVSAAAEADGTLDEVCREVTLIKELRLLPNPDPDAGWESVLSVPTEPFPREVEYRFTLTNSGDTDESITVTDIFLCQDVDMTPGVELIPGECILCEAVPPGESGVITDTVPAGATTSHICRLSFTTEADLIAFLTLDDDRPQCRAETEPGAADPCCYRNCALLSALMADNEVCGVAPEMEDQAFSTICFAGDQPISDPDGPYSTECVGPTVTVLLDGSGSSDSEPAYAWSTDCPGGTFDDPSAITPLLTFETSLGCEETCNVTLTVTAGCNGSDTASTTVGITDDVPPLIACPPDAVADCDESTDPSNTGTATATDECDENPVCTFTDVLEGTCPTVIIRTWTCTDACGNSSSCPQTIDVDDTTPPQIACPPDIDLACDESTDPSNTGTAKATDDCDENPVCTFTDVSDGTCPTVITRTWTCTDSCGNSSSCPQTINVDDTTPPQITCPPDVTVNCDELTDPSNTGTATATDDCDENPVCTFTDVSDGTCPTVITRTWTCTDSCGNSSSCPQTINVDDNTPPQVACPSDVTVNCDESTDPADTGTATATDDCDENPVCTFTDVSDGTCPTVIIRTWTCTDTCGNSGSCDQTINVDDNTPPQVACPPDIDLACDDSTDPADTGTATATDDCDENPVCTFTDVSDGTCPTVITRTWTCTDSCGNFGSCPQTINVDDTVPPTIECPPFIELPEGSTIDPSTTGEPVATDDCGTPSVEFSDLTDNRCPEMITRTWVARDSCGLTDSCVQTIVVNCPDEIPTVSEWGMVIMTLLLLTLSKIHFGRLPVGQTGRGDTSATAQRDCRGRPADTRG